MWRHNVLPYPDEGQPGVQQEVQRGVVLRLHVSGDHVPSVAKAIGVKPLSCQIDFKKHKDIYISIQLFNNWNEIAMAQMLVSWHVAMI